MSVTVIPFKQVQNDVALDIVAYKVFGTRLAQQTVKTPDAELLLLLLLLLLLREEELLELRLVITMVKTPEAQQELAEIPENVICRGLQITDVWAKVADTKLSQEMPR